MVTDVSKYLRFCAGPVAEEPDFKHFVNRELLLAYLEKVKRAGLKVGGRLAKLDTFEAALRFIKMYKQALHISEVLKQWKGTWRPDKHVRMQKQSQEELGLEDVTSLIECPEMWPVFLKRTKEAQTCLLTNEREMDQCSTFIATVLVYRYL